MATAASILPGREPEVLRLARARVLTAIVVLLAALAAGAGLYDADLYRDPAVLVPAIRGQDLVTLLTLPVLLASLLVRSTRARLVWIGLLGYLVYTYTGAAFAYRFNALFLVYLTLFTLSLGALWTAVAATAPGVLADLARQPRRATIGFLLSIALVLGSSELAQVGAALEAGQVPALIARSEGAGNFVYVLDLGVILPLSVLAAVWLHRRARWGVVLAGALVIKAAAMGLALISGTWFAARAGAPVEVALTAAYGAIALGGLALAGWLAAAVR